MCDQSGVIYFLEKNVERELKKNCNSGVRWAGDVQQLTVWGVRVFPL